MMRPIAILVFFASTYLYSLEPIVLKHAIVSIYAVRSDTGEVLIDHNSDLSLIPASCMKIVTTGAALHLLGKESRFETVLEYDGLIDDEKTLRGNLYIRGGGDPCLGSDRIKGSLSWKEQIARWCDAVHWLGVRKIEGKIIADTTCWEKACVVPGWAWEDLGNYYGAGACALSFHENFYSLYFKPADAVGEPATIMRTDPPIATLALHNEVKTGSSTSGDQTCIYGSEFSPIQYVRGTVPIAVQEFEIKGSIPDPARCCIDLFSKRLQEKGIPIEGQELSNLTVRIPFHTTYSPTLKEIVHETNQNSINLYAEHLLKKMGEATYGEGSTAAGIKAVNQFWTAQNIDLEGFNMVDGSGLSRKNLITTKQLVAILLKIKRSEYFPLFLESLPQREGKIRAKSGTMSLVKGYTGYVNNIAFAILVNQCLHSELMNEKINDFLLDLKLSSSLSLKKETLPYTQVNSILYRYAR